MSVQTGSSSSPLLQDAMAIQASGDEVRLPDGFNMADAGFARVGGDLVLSDPDGTSIAIEGFFDSEAPPALVGDGGFMLPAHTAARLAGPQAAGMVAGEIPAGEAIGKISSLSGEIVIIRADGTRLSVDAGAPVFPGDVIETGVGEGIGILLADGTSVAVGENARMVLDELIYDPGAQEGSISLSVMKGLFTIVSGQIAKTDPEAMLVNTPAATIGIRGTQVGIDLTDGKNLKVVMMEESDGFVGEVIIINDAGVMTINQAYFAVEVNGFKSAPMAMPIYDVSDVVRVFGSTLYFLSPESGTANSYGMEAVIPVIDDATELAGLETAAGGADAPVAPTDEVIKVTLGDGSSQLPPSEGLDQAF
ncbi:MAG: FecR domain-containing protein, partial [Rhodospirillaceae bacterium]|nr:FecR domain-containing protein [Rhodospirillaceae bacterium]